jgi:hypothetical protein
LITIEGNGTVRTTVITKHLDGNTKQRKVLFCYDFMNGVIVEEEEVLLQVESDLFTIGTITLSELKMGTLVLTTEVFGVDFGTKDLTFDFPHILGEIKVHTTPTCIKV